MFPRKRMRRRRLSEGLRRLANETRLSRDMLILPLFAVAGTGRSEPVPAMPGVCRLSVDLLVRRAAELSVPAVLLFGVPDAKEKDATGSAAANPKGIVPTAVKAIKKQRPDLVVIVDVCLCGYTEHGHCGILDDSGRVDNDATLPALAAVAVACAAAGADVIAPSAMMDGQVRALREALDEKGFSDTLVMSYAAKFASAFYGPFRDAAHSSPSFGDRRGYQLPPGNCREAIDDALLDEAEGADWLMVKPAMPYLDVLKELRSLTRLPIAAYQVSGEYAMLKSAAEAGALDEPKAVLESLLAIRRAGASAVITYYAEEAAKWLES
ncbi:MAG: porphobilinogen synthase [Planctomycetia bacterium]|nr:porphobilinogen synthase [Planctomycetia bacterium]